MADQFVLSDLDGGDPVSIYVAPGGYDTGRWQDRGARLAPGGDGGSRYDEGAIHPSGRQVVLAGEIADGDIYEVYRRYMAGGSYLLTGWGDAANDIPDEAWKVEFDTQRSQIADAWQRGDPLDASDRAAIYRPCSLVFWMIEQLGPLVLVPGPGPYYPGRRLSLRIMLGGVEQDWGDFSLATDNASAACIPAAAAGYVDLGLPGIQVEIQAYRLSDNAPVTLTITIQRPHSNFVAIREDAPSCVLHPITEGSPGRLFAGYDTRFALADLGGSDGLPVPAATPVELEFRTALGVTVAGALWSCDGITFVSNPHTCSTGSNGWLQPSLRLPADLPPGDYIVAVTPDDGGIGAPTVERPVTIGQVVSATMPVVAPLTANSTDPGSGTSATITGIAYTWPADHGGRTRYPEGSTRLLWGDSRQNYDPGGNLERGGLAARKRKAGSWWPLDDTNHLLITADGIQDILQHLSASGELTMEIGALLDDDLWPSLEASRVLPLQLVEVATVSGVPTIVGTIATATITVQRGS